MGGKDDDRKGFPEEVGTEAHNHVSAAEIISRQHAAISLQQARRRVHVVHDVLEVAGAAG